MPIEDGAADTSLGRYIIEAGRGEPAAGEGARGPKDIAFGGDPAFGWDESRAIEDVLELAVEVLEGRQAQHVLAASNTACLWQQFWQQSPRPERN